MPLCEKNVLEIPLSAAYPDDDDVIIITKTDGTSVLTRWAVVKPKPLWDIYDVVGATIPAGTHIEMPALNGIVFDRIDDIIRTGASCRNIVSGAPSGPDIQFVPSAGAANAYVVLASDAFDEEWIKVKFI